MKKIDSKVLQKMSVEELEKQVAHHNALYFEKNAPEISDYDFDRLVERLKKLKPHSSVLQSIPSDVATKTSKKVRHSSAMLSLDKCYHEKDLESWLDKFEGKVLASPKIDGLATELRYDEKGNLFLAATRGDGVVGEEITSNVRAISDVPQKISEGPLEIRGEIYMRLSVFEKYRENFANPRNLAAGAVKQKDPNKTRDYSLSFFGYDILGLSCETEEEKIKKLHQFKVPTVETKLCERAELQETYNYFLTKRDQRDYETDGVVFRANEVSEQVRLGVTAHHPRYAIAYKFQGDSGLTTLKEVEWSVARTRVITPVGVVEPVELSGATVTHVSLHNYGLMKKLGLRKGSKVLMMRRGGVIPNLESVVEAGKGNLIHAPEKCPSCGAPVEEKEDFLYCSNQSGCRKAKLQELEHFIKVIECDGFGEKLIEQLYDNGFVQDAADFYSLKKQDLLELERMGEILATKLIRNLEERKTLALETFLRALGIRELAKHSSKILVREFGSLSKIREVSEEDLSAIHSIGPIIAKEVTQGLKRKKALIEKLLKKITLIEGKNKTASGKLSGQTFLFTGTLAAMDRKEAEAQVKERGGEIASGVTKDLDYLVIGSEGYKNREKGNKWLKAEKLIQQGASLQIISEEEFLKML